MNLFHTTTYHLYQKYIQRDYKIAVISDIHFSYLVTNKKLFDITNYLKSLNIDYILIAGDLIDSVNMIEDTHEYYRLLHWLKSLGDIATTLISFGSHDYCRKEYYANPKMQNKFYWEYQLDSNFIKDIDKIPNVYALNNNTYEDSNLYIAGITNSFAYYYPKSKKNEKINEDKQQLLIELQQLKYELLKNLPKNKINLAMLHSPIYLIDTEIQKELKEFDYFISGHMHNGCVPPILYELWNTVRGLIAPNKSLFPKTERNTLKYKNDKLITNGPITMFHECAGPMSIFNCLYPTYIGIMNITKDKTYDQEKIKITKKYQKLKKH